MTFGYFDKHHFSKICCGYFLGYFWYNWAILKPKIWSRCSVVGVKDSSNLHLKMFRIRTCITCVNIDTNEKPFKEQIIHHLKRL